MKLGLKKVWKLIQANKHSEFFVSRKQRYTYHQLVQHIKHACTSFDEAGLTIGDRVLISLLDEFQASACFLAAQLDGLVPTIVSSEMAVEQRASIAQSLDARLILDENNPPCTPKRFLKRLRISSISSRAPKLPQLDDNALAYILFTSGTTAAPRGVEVTHKNLFSQLETLIRLFDYAPNSRIFNGTPLAHTDGLVQGPLLAVATGATLLRPGLFQISDLENWLDFLRGETATHMITNPTLLTIILRLAQEDDYFDKTMFKVILSTGGVLTDEVWSNLEDRFGVRVCNVYGMTETVADALYAGAHPEMGAQGTIGRPVDCKARIAGDDVVGELELTGDNIVPGYWCDKARTVKSKTADGWFRTGDIARLRPDGSFVYLGRSKTIINQGAVTIYPEEINEAMMSHPYTLEVFTLGLPHDEFEEIAVSAVVLSQPVDNIDLCEHCNAKLEPLKRPKHIVAVNSFPKSPSGKVDVFQLKKKLQEIIASTAPEAEVDAKGSLHERIVTIAAGVFGVSKSKLGPNTSTITLSEWDSFNHLRLMMEVEEKFDLTLSTKDIVSIHTLSDIVKKLDKA